jgi:hypothetical protein
MKKPIIIAAVAAGVVIVGGLGALVATSLGGSDEPVDCSVTPLPEGCPIPVIDGGTGPTGTTGSPTGPTGATGVVTGATGATGGPTGSTGSTGETVTIGGGQVVVPVPAGWEVVSQGETTVALLDPLSNYVVFEFFEFGEAVTASFAAQDYVDVVIVDNEAYSNVQTADAQAGFDPFGSITDSAYVDYSGTWTTQQGAFEVVGTVIAAVKADGTTLFTWIETEGTWEQADTDSVSVVVGPTVNSFGAS